MKKINLLFLSILLCFSACQKKIELDSSALNETLNQGKDLLREISTANFYYWSAKRKIPLSVDSSIIILQWPSSDSLELKAIIKSDNELVKIKDSLFAIKAQNNLFKSKVLQTLTSKAKSVNISFRSNDRPFIPTGEIILMPKPNTSIQAILTKYSEEVDLVKRKKYNRYALKSKKFEETIHIANQIYESGLVEWCHPDFIAQIQYFSNDTYYSNQYYLNQSNNFDINIPQAWSLLGNLNCPVRVAVIDDGVEAHPDLAPLATGYTAGNSAGQGAPTSGSAHGEAVAGIIAALKDNSIGVAGIASNSTIVPINIHNAGSFQDIADAINWAWDEGNADILSCSWGIDYCDDIATAITLARTNGRDSKGTIVVFASGNSGSTGGVSFPGNVSGVITVGSIDRNGNIWSYSQRGPEMDLVTPSGNTSLLGDVYTIDRVGINGYNPGDYMTNFGGTSAACPQVAGVAALMLAANPSLTETQVKTILQQTATDMGTSGFDNTYGYGRLNAQAAVQACLPFIAGPDEFCDTATYTVNNLPPGASVSWGNDPSYTVTSLNSNNSKVLITKVANDQSAFLHPTITSTCGSISLNKRVAVGAFTYISVRYSSGTTQNHYIVNCANLQESDQARWYEADIQIDDPITGTVTWTKVSTNPINVQLQGSGRTYHIGMRPGQVTYDLTVTNSCGSFTKTITFYTDNPTACPN